MVGQKSGYTSVGKNGLAKANKFQELVAQWDWDCKIKVDDTGLTHLFARRGESETIDIWWQPPNGSIGKGAGPIYKLAGEVIRLNNVSACVSIASKPADTSRIGRAVKRQHRRIRRGKSLAQQADISPLSDDEGSSGGRTTPDAIQALSALGNAIPALSYADDADLREALSDRRIEWINSQSGLIESAHIGKIRKIVRNGHDYVDFLDKTGFHSVYLDKIVGIA